MNIKSIVLFPAAMLLAVAAAPKDASAHNFPGWQAHPLDPSQPTCWQGVFTGLKNVCAAKQHLIMPLQGNNGGTQTLTATVFVPDGIITGAQCQWVSTDTTNQFRHFTPFVSAAAAPGSSAINLSLNVFDPGGSYLDCALEQNARLDTVIYTQ